VTDRLRWDPRLTKIRSGKPLRRDRVRLALVIGAVITAIGAMLPWAEGRIGFLRVAFGGMDGAADGLILGTLALVLILIARNPGFIEAPDAGRRWAPMIIGLVCVGLWLLGRQRAEIEIAHWTEDDGSGSIVGGFWLAGLGVAIVAVAGSYASLRTHEGETSSATSFVRMPRRSDAIPLLTWLGGIAGLVGGVLLALAIFPPVTVGAPIVFFAGIGLVAGAFAGRSLGRGIVRVTR
jgi:hypothetical protein